MNIDCFINILGGSSMDLESIWSVFLSKIEIKLKPVLYQTWFQETKLIDLNNEYAVVEVPLDVP